MNRSNLPIDDAVKNKLQQHEFEFDLSAWEALDKQLDNQGDVKTGFKWAKLISAFLGLGLLLLLVWSVSTDQGWRNTGNMEQLSEAGYRVDESEYGKENQQKDWRKKESEGSGMQQAEHRDVQEVELLTGAGMVVGSSREHGEVASEYKNKNKEELSRNEPEHKVKNIEGWSDHEQAWTMESRKGVPAGSSGFGRTQTGGALAESNHREDKDADLQGKPFSTYPVASSTHSVQIPLPAAKQQVTKRNVRREQVTTFSKLESPLSKVVSSNTAGVSADQLLSPYKHFHKTQIRKPFRWYLGASVGVYFPTFKNGNIKITRDLGSWRSNKGKRFFAEAKFGLQLRSDFALEFGLSHVAIPYQYRYSYWSDTAPPKWGEETLEQTVHQFSLPIRGQFKILDQFRFNIGAGVSWRVLNQKSLANHEPPSGGEAFYEATKAPYRPWVAFWESGLSYDRGNWTLDLKYQYFFTPLFNEFTYQGLNYRKHTQEWNFVVAFGHRFQRHKDPTTVVRSTIGLSQRHTINQVFNGGIGLATGWGKSSLAVGNGFGAAQIFTNITDFKNPLKIGLWVDYQLSPSFRLQMEFWGSQSTLNYELNNYDFTPGILNGQFKSTLLEFPMTLHYCFPENIRLIGGLSLAHNIAKSPSLNYFALYPDYRPALEYLDAVHYRNTILYGDLGVGYDQGAFSLDLRFQPFLYVFSKQYLKSSGSPYFGFISTRNQITLSLRYAFKQR